MWGLDEDRELSGIEVKLFDELARNDPFKTVRLIAVRVLSNLFEPESSEIKTGLPIANSILLSIMRWRDDMKPSKLSCRNVIGSM